MFGNAIGWVISAVIAALSVMAGYSVYETSLPTAPSNWAMKEGRPLKMDASAILGPPTKPNDDAGHIYRDAISDFEKHPSQYTEHQGDIKPDDIGEVASIKGLGLLDDARHCGTATIFRKDPKEVVNFDNEIPALSALVQVARTSTNLAMNFGAASADAQPNYPKAEKFAMASFALGYDLYKERLVWTELEAGEQVMGSAAAVLKVVYEGSKKKELLDKITAFDDARKQEYDQNLEPVRQIFFDLSEDNLNKHAGDIFSLARDPKADIVWQVEATRRVGHMRYFATNLADQRRIPRFLAMIAADPKRDDAVKIAAQASLNMTPLEHQSSR